MEAGTGGRNDYSGGGPIGYEGAATAAATSAPSGYCLMNRYELGRELGRGGMGVVYLAHDLVLGRQVAIKMIQADQAELIQGQRLVDRWMREARAAALVSHPAVVAVYDVFRQGDQAFIVMEYVPGRSLEEYGNSNRNFVGSHLALLRQIAEGLDFAHSRGVVHRDIKPANLLVDGSGRVHITDFGIAKAPSNEKSATGIIVGTIKYMAREQICGEPVDGRADQFSLGVVAYQLLTGQHLFKGVDSFASLSYKMCHEEPPPLSSVNPSLPASVDMVFSRVLAKQANQRYGSCMEFVDALEQACMPMSAFGKRHATPMPFPASTDSRALPARKPAVNPEFGVIAALTLFLSGAVGLFLMWVSQDMPMMRVAKASAPVPPAFGLARIPPAPILLQNPATVGSKAGAGAVMPSQAPAGRGSGTPTLRIRVGAAAQQAKALQQPRPAYPPLARQARVQGTVRLAATIGSDGTVKALRLIAGHPLLVPPCLEVVHKWTYQPTLFSGKAVEVETEIEVKFRLDAPVEKVQTQGELAWTGRLDRNGDLVAEPGAAGWKGAAFPGSPVAIRVSPPLDIKVMPGAGNGWRRLVLHNHSGRVVTRVIVQWSTIPAPASSPR